MSNETVGKIVFGETGEVQKITFNPDDVSFDVAVKVVENELLVAAQNVHAHDLGTGTVFVTLQAAYGAALNELTYFVSDKSNTNHAGKTLQMAMNKWESGRHNWRARIAAERKQLDDEEATLAAMEVQS